MLLPATVKEPPVKSKNRRRSAKRARSEQKILEKIHREGIGSLTKRERTYLERASRRHKP